ncbi:MAG: hypothetical protein JAY75_10165, partial [Candidatus Thiodiazotropha taylori]|nr:hypothetical protein [Candidatus Thiodiazotropha taylori]MCW4308580.1 hypothetical protein [Candidatus Thiodiazotropha endolucinida]
VLNVGGPQISLEVLSRRGLELDRDYTLSVTGGGLLQVSGSSLVTKANYEQSDAGTYTVTVNGTDAYTGSISKTFGVMVSASDLVVHIDASTLTDLSGLATQPGVSSYRNVNLLPNSSPDGTKNTIEFTVASGITVDDLSSILFDTDISMPMVAIVYQVEGTGQHENWLLGSSSQPGMFYPNLTGTNPSLFFHGDWSNLKNAHYNGASTAWSTIDRNTEWNILIVEAGASLSVNCVGGPFMQYEGRGLIGKVAEVRIWETAVGAALDKDAIFEELNTKWNVKSKLSDTLSIDPVSDITVSAGVGGSSSVTISNGSLIEGTDYTLSVVKADGTSISSVTIGGNGTITIASSITQADAGQLKVLATGIGDYYGVVESNEFNLIVN